jgi:uncharacterized damage-inducible protein DinB
MAIDIEGLLRLLDESFGKSAAWHGTNLRGALRGLDLKQASWRPKPGRHNIWEIALHTAYWKYAVRRRITGEKRGSFCYPGSNWFVRPGKLQSNSWKHDVAALEEENRLLREVVSSLPPERLSEPSARKKWTLAEMVMGVAFHDIYHAGQIQLLKRLQKQS